MKARSKIDIYKIILAAIILCQLVFTVFMFNTGKGFFHSDETWSYGLSNSYYRAHIYLEPGVWHKDPDALNKTDNIGSWVKGDVFRDYITVQKGERFSYASVYSNNTCDIHPPLYYWIINTICSFFPDSFSWWYGFSFNLLMLVLIQVFLYKLTLLYSKKKWLSLACCALYGAGNGALMTFTFIRQYALMTFLLILFTYLSAMIYEHQADDKARMGDAGLSLGSASGKTIDKYIVMAAIAAYLSFMTLYLSIAFIGVFTAAFCLYLLLHKRFRLMLKYGLSILMSLILMIASYPAGIKHMQNYDSNGQMIWSFPVQLRMYINRIMAYNFGLYINPYGTPFFKIMLPFVGLFILFACMLYIPLRNEAWMPGLIKRLKDSPKAFWNFIKNADHVWLFVLLAIAGELIMVNLSADIYKMGVFATRYVFAMFPFAVFIMVGLIDKLLEIIIDPKNKRPKMGQKIRLCVSYALCIVIMLLTHINSDADMLSSDYTGAYDLAREFEGKNIVMILEDNRYAWTLTCFPRYIYKADNVFVTYPEQMQDNNNKLIDSDKHIDYVIIPALNYTTSGEETKLVNELLGVSDDATEEEKNSKLLIDTSTYDQKHEEDAIKCNDHIKELNNGSGYDLMCCLSINTGLDYVIRMR